MSYNSTIYQFLSKKLPVLALIILASGFTSVQAKSNKIDTPLAKSVRLHMWEYGLTEIGEQEKDSVSLKSSGSIKMSNSLKRALKQEKSGHLIKDDNER